MNTENEAITGEVRIAPVAPASVPVLFSELTDPDQIIAAATLRANKLSAIVEKQHLSVEFPGNTQPFLQIEAWQILGQFCGYITKVVSVEEIHTVDGFHGYRAVAECCDARTGIVRGREYGECTTAEENWRVRTKGEWMPTAQAPADAVILAHKRDGSAVKVMAGETPVPDFQRLSMSQTRAKSRAYAAALGWISNLAGYSATTAEDMGHYKREAVDAEEVQTKKVSRGTTAPTDGNESKVADQAAWNAFWGEMGKHFERDEGGKKFAPGAGAFITGVLGQGWKKESVTQAQMETLKSRLGKLPLLREPGES